MLESEKCVTITAIYASLSLANFSHSIQLDSENLEEEEEVKSICNGRAT